jgi:hypothetical protein
VHQVDAGHELEQLAGDVLDGADAARAVIDPTGILFGSMVPIGAMSRMKLKPRLL